MFRSRLTIIVPTLNRFERLYQLIESLLEAFPLPDRPRIYIVDDGSKDETAHLKSMSKENLTVLHISNGGPARARNIGSYFAQTKYILFVDDDCIIPVNYKKYLAPFFINILKMNGMFLVEECHLVIRVLIS